MPIRRINALRLKQLPLFTPWNTASHPSGWANPEESGIPKTTDLFSKEQKSSEMEKCDKFGIWAIY